jgi:SAM-dependent methyltransferase
LDEGRRLFPQYHFAQGDILDIPFPRETFDVVFSMAVLHQIPSPELRRLAVSNMHQVLKPGGWLFINVWNLWKQPHLGQIRRNNWKHFFGLTPYDRNDILVPWRRSGVEQYYHAFTANELKHLLQRNGFRVEHVWFSRGTNAPTAKQSDNIAIIAKRI